MKKNIISLIVSTFLIASLNAFSVSADETQVQGMGAGSIDDIVSNVVSDITFIEDTTNTSNSETTSIEDTTNTSNSETTSIEDTTTTLNSETTSIIDSITSLSDETTTEDTTIITTFETALEETTTFAIQQVSNSKNIILDLDVSASMSGTPLNAMKEAAIEFCTKMLDADPNAKIAIVAFGSDSEVGVEYTNDLNSLVEYIDGLSLMGATNMFDSFEDVKLLLETSDGDAKNVIIMADGMPNSSPSDYDHTGIYSYSANATLNYDNDNLKPLATIYTIGYFHNLADSEKDNAESFMKDLASNDALYYNADIDSINVVFNQIANDIIVKDETTYNNITIGDSSSTTNSTTTQAKADSPQTSDNGVSSIIIVSALTGIALMVSKKNR